LKGRRENSLEFFAGHGFDLQQAVGHRIQLITVLHDDRLRLRIGIIDQAANFTVDLGGNLGSTAIGSKIIQAVDELKGKTYG